MVDSCTLRSLGDSLDAASRAAEQNPANAPARAASLSLGPQHLALLTTRYWGPASRRLRVRFLERVPSGTRFLILQHLNAWWGVGAGIRFVLTSGEADVRITLEDEGYWSYLGTDVLLIPQEEATMCLQGFSSATPLAEYRRVVRHEAGHTLGFDHEHMRAEIVERIDPARAYEYFARTQGWSEREVRQQVLTPRQPSELTATAAAEETSVMCYQLPASITRDLLPIRGGVDITAMDAEFARRVYPRRLR